MSPWQEPPETFVGCAVQGQHVLIAGQTTASASQGVVMLFSSVTSKKKKSPSGLDTTGLCKEENPGPVTCLLVPTVTRCSVPPFRSLSSEPVGRPHQWRCQRPMSVGREGPEPLPGWHWVGAEAQGPSGPRVPEQDSGLWCGFLPPSQLSPAGH